MDRPGFIEFNRSDRSIGRPPHDDADPLGGVWVLGGGPGEAP